MTDVESSAPPRRNRPENPYADSTQVYSTWHPVNLFWRILWMGGSLYGLERMEAYHAIMHSPDISHEWFKIGLAASLGEFGSHCFCTQVLVSN